MPAAWICRIEYQAEIQQKNGCKQQIGRGGIHGESEHDGCGRPENASLHPLFHGEYRSEAAQGEQNCQAEYKAQYPHAGEGRYPQP